MEKTRDISIIQFFEVLQKEYIVAELRKKIYPKLNDKNYYSRLMSQKKVKIEDISSRNNLPNIFNDEYTKREYYSMVYNTQGIPTFIYRDDAERRKLQGKDFEYYYSLNADVKVVTQTQTVVGKIDDTDLEANVVYVKIKGSKQTVPCHTSNVTRIL